MGNLINMSDRMKEEFPKLYTYHGKVSKKAPKKYKCDCGNEFNKTKKHRVGGVVFGIKECPECGDRAKNSLDYDIWSRLVVGDIKKEDYILTEIIKKGVVDKKTILEKLNNKFEDAEDYLGHSTALGTLCYFGYLKVNKYKRDELGKIEYSVNENKDLQNRYKTIR